MCCTKSSVLTAADPLSKRQPARLMRVLASDDPTKEIRATLGGKALLRPRPIIARSGKRVLARADEGGTSRVKLDATSRA